jgi:hypothetical protein
MTTAGAHVPRTKLAFDVHDDVPEPEGGIVDDGVGARLVLPFEARGCSTFFLETFSFQAPSFHESLGYVHATEFHGFPHGIVKYVMVRHAVPTDGRPDPARGPRQRQGRG